MLSWGLNDVMCKIRYIEWKRPHNNDIPKMFSKSALEISPLEFWPFISLCHVVKKDILWPHFTSTTSDSDVRKLMTILYRYLTYYCSLICSLYIQKKLRSSHRNFFPEHFSGIFSKNISVIWCCLVWCQMVLSQCHNTGKFMY